jgi:hypothetical protein
MSQKMDDIGAAPGEEIVCAEHFSTLGQQAFAEMGAKKAGAAGHQDTPGLIAGGF